MDRGALLILGAKYGVLYAGVTVFAVYLGSQSFDYPFEFATLAMLLATLTIVPLLFAVSDAGLDTSEAGGVAGFRNITDPSQYRPEGFSLPGKLQISCYLIGIAAYSVAGLLFVV